MNFLEAYKINETRRVRLKKSNQDRETNWYGFGELAWKVSDCGAIGKEILGEWEAEEVPQVVEFELDCVEISAIKSIAALRNKTISSLEGKRWRVRCEEIR